MPSRCAATDLLDLQCYPPAPPSEDRHRLIGNGEIFSNAHFRNNLFLGADGRGCELFRFPNATSYSTYDYNGYRPNRGGGDQYFWKAPRKGVLRDYSLEGEEFQRFRTLAEFRAATGQEMHSIAIR